MKSGTKVSPIRDCEDIQDKTSSAENLKVLEAEHKTGCKVQNGRFKSTVLEGWNFPNGWWPGGSDGWNQIRKGGFD